MELQGVVLEIVTNCRVVVMYERLAYSGRTLRKLCLATQLFLPMAASVLHIVMWRRLVHPPTHNKEGLKAGTAMG